MIKQYRRKPLLVTAIQWTGGNLMEVIAFAKNQSIEEFKATLNEKVWTTYETSIKEHGQIVELSPDVFAYPNENFVHVVQIRLTKCILSLEMSQVVKRLHFLVIVS